MSIFVSQQFFEFFVLLYGGIIAMFVYDILSVYRQYFSLKKVFLTVQDILYWIWLASFSIYLLYYASLGSIKAYSFFALILGALLYKLVLSTIIKKMIYDCIGIIRKLFMKINKNKNTPS
ncbi:MAG: hypothetical protein GX285_02560 [Clostridiales bacterium]|nr:hypothetical protein [Clostridiales bacterium]